MNGLAGRKVKSLYGPVDRVRSAAPAPGAADVVLLVQIALRPPSAAMTAPVM